MTSAFSDLESQAVSGVGPLRRAERLIVRAVARGDIAKVGLRRPEVSSDETAVRAGFLAWMLRSGLPIRGRRLQIIGAFVEGRLDLGDAQIACTLWFYRCHFDAPVLLDGASVRGAVSFSGCEMASLLADGCQIAQGLSINAGTSIEHELRLRRARIDGDLDCSRISLRSHREDKRGRRALNADEIRVGGDLRLNEGAQAVGEVRLVGAQIGGDLRIGGIFNGSDAEEGRRGAALRLDRVEVAGSLVFDPGVGTAGCVSLKRAQVGGDVDLSGANFNWLGDSTWGRGCVLALDRARIEGALVLREQQSPLVGASFVDARVGELCDDGSTWGEQLRLDGFRYERLGDGAPLDTRFRTGWLLAQETSHVVSQFRVQPWRMLIRVMRRMGHERRAGSIALAREQWLRRIGFVGHWAPSSLRWLPRAGHSLLGALVGHGQRPERLLLLAALTWGLCGGAYAWIAAEAASPAVADFSAWGHAFDRLLPWSGADGAAVWRGDSAGAVAARWLGRVETVIGTACLLLATASLAGWLDRDRRR